MATVKLQLVDPAGHFDYNGTTLSGDEVKEFPNTNDVVKRAVSGRIVRVLHADNIAPTAAAIVAEEQPATKPVRVPRTPPPTGAAND